MGCMQRAPEARVRTVGTAHSWAVFTDTQALAGREVDVEAVLQARGARTGGRGVRGGQ